MRITVTFDLECDPDTTWRALHAPAVIASVYGPLLRMRSEGPMPAALTDGDTLRVRLLVWPGLVVGRQLIRITDEREFIDGRERRTMHDRGQPLRGPLALLRGWHHRMSLTPSRSLPGGTTWHDTLEATGPFAALYRPALALVWRMRAARIRRLARGW